MTDVLDQPPTLTIRAKAGEEPPDVLPAEAFQHSVPTTAPTSAPTITIKARAGEEPPDVLPTSAFSATPAPSSEFEKTAALSQDLSKPAGMSAPPTLNAPTYEQQQQWAAARPKPQTIGQDIANIPGYAYGKLKSTAAGMAAMETEPGPLSGPLPVVGGLVQKILPQDPMADATNAQMRTVAEQGRKEAAQTVAAHPIQSPFVRIPTDVGASLAPALMSGGAAPLTLGGMVGGDVYNAVMEKTGNHELATAAAQGAQVVGTSTAGLFSGPAAMAPGLVRTAVGGAVGTAATELPVAAIEHAATGQPMPSVREMAGQIVSGAGVNAGIHALTQGLAGARPDVSRAEPPHPPQELQPRGLVGAPEGPTAVETMPGQAVEPFPREITIRANEPPPDVIPQEAIAQTPPAGTPAQQPTATGEESGARVPAQRPEPAPAAPVFSQEAAPAPTPKPESPIPATPEKEVQPPLAPQEQAAPASPELKPPAGKLDALELWARGRLEAKSRAEAAAVAQAPEGRQRFRGSAGSLDPERLVLYAAIGAAKIGRGINKAAAWTADMVKEFPELAKRAIPEVWRAARRLHGMDEDTRSQWVTSRLEQPQTETTKQTVRRMTGQVDTGKLVPEVDALEASMRSAQKASREGYRAGVTAGVEQATAPRVETVGQRVRRVTGQTDLSEPVSEAEALGAGMRRAQQASTAGFRAGVEQKTALQKELVRIVRETLPPEERGQLLNRVAEVGGLRGLRYGIQKVRGVLADYDVRQTIAKAEKVTGTLKLDPIQGPQLPPVQGPENRPTVPQRPVDLTKLAEPYRGEVKGLVAQMRGAKQSLLAAHSIEDKYTGIDRVRDIETQIREKVAEHEALRQTRIGERFENREVVVDKLVRQIKPPPETDVVSDEAPHDANLVKRMLGRGSLSMETIATHIDPEKGDAHAVTIANVRRAQEDFYREQQKWRDHISGALKDAGYEPGTRKLDNFLNERSEVTLPDAGKVQLKRNQMVGLVASAEDPQTQKLIVGRSGQGGQIERPVWTFKENALATPFKLTPKDFQALREQMTPTELSLIKSFKDYNKQNMTARLMQASMNLKGSAPDPHEGYYPRARNRRQTINEQVPQGWRGYFNEAIENISSLKERAPDLKQPLYVPEFVQDTFKYMDDAAKIIHLAEPVRNVAMVWEDPRVKSAVERRFGNSMNKRVQDFLADTMMVRQRPARVWIEKYSSALMKNVSRAWLQANPSPMLKNVFGGSVSLMPVFETRDLVAGLGSMFSPKVYRRMTKESSVAWNRYNGGLYGQYSPLTGKHVETVAEMKFLEAAKGLKPGAAVDALPFMQWADSVPLRVAYTASEHYVNRTMPDAAPAAKQRAILDKFHNAIYDTQNGTSSTEISGIATAARKNPLAAPLLMFTSDSNKRYNLLAKMKGADTATRAKTAVALGLNAMIASALGYGIKSGVSAVGRSIGGAPEDKEELHGRRQGFNWDLARNVFSTVYGGDKLLDLGRGLFTNQEPNISDPNSKLETDMLNAVMSTVKAISAYASSAVDSPGETKAIDRVQTALGNLFAAGQTAAGSPTAPWWNYVRRAINAGSFEEPDPRKDAKKHEAAQTKLWHDALPGRVQTLLAEKNRLDSIGRGKLTSSERQRTFALFPIEQAYQNYTKFKKEKNDRAAGIWQKQLETRAARVADVGAAASKAK